MSEEIGNDLLSPLCEALIDASGEHYTALVVQQSATAPAALGIARAEQLLRKPLLDEAAGKAMLAALWLWHDCLEQSHNISQKLDNPTGSFWHAIMHRREGDFSNSKYWYARCRTHPVLIGSDWDPVEFVDRVDSIHEQPAAADYKRVVELQQLEWRQLFAWCARQAAGV